MKYFIPEDIALTDSSIPEHTDENGTAYSVWAIASGYEQDKTISHSGSLYKARTNIYPLATYSWNDISNLETPTIVRLADQAIITPTSVPCVQDETVVYVLDTWKAGAEDVIGKYYLYKGATTDVDFTNIDPSSPANWTEIRNYRHEIYEPPTTAPYTSLYWEYIGKTNRNKVVDKAYNSQSVVYEATKVWWEAEVTSPNRITIFNIQAPKAKITIYTNDIETPIYESIIEDLLDETSIVNWRNLVLYRNIYTKNATWQLPFLTGTYTVRVTLFNDTPVTLKAGEILAGTISDFGITLDGVPIQVKSAGQIIEQDNGDVIFQDEGNITKVYTIFNFNMKYDTPTHDSILDKCAEIINRRVVVIADDDDGEYRTFNIYGFIRDASPTLTTNSTQSDIKLQIQRFR